MFADVSHHNLLVIADRTHKAVAAAAAPECTEMRNPVFIVYEYNFPFITGILYYFFFQILHSLALKNNDVTPWGFKL